MTRGIGSIQYEVWEQNMGNKAHCSQTIYYQYWKCYIQKGIKQEQQYADKARDWEWEYEVCEQNIGNKGNCLHTMLVGSFIKTRILKEQYTDKAWDWEWEFVIGIQGIKLIVPTQYWHWECYNEQNKKRGVVSC